MGKKKLASSDMVYSLSKVQIFTFQFDEIPQLKF